MEEAVAQPERRSDTRYAVDAEVTLVIVSLGASVRGRICQISLDGCRVRTDKPISFAAPAGIEIIFKINGIAFRLGGVLQWADSQQSAGIQFGSMAPRRRDAVLELLAELEAEEQAEAANQAAMTAAQESEIQKEAASPQAAPGVNSAGAVREVPSPPTGCVGSVGMQMPLRLPPPADPPVSTSGSTLKAAQPWHASGGHLNVVTPAAEPAAQASRPAPKGRERRAQARHSVDTGATVFFIDVRVRITGRILDLSMSGCRIRTDERFPVGIYRRVETEFKVDGLPFRLGGVVQSLHDKFTVGIRFLDLSSRKRDQLAQLMEEIAEMHKQPCAGAQVTDASSI
jgi:PilZ domain